nr:MULTISPECIES: hypothetical protein [Chryseobacterium]
MKLGKDFLFVGEEYKLQVGNSDFLLIYYSVIEGCNVW